MSTTLANNLLTDKLIERFCTLCGSGENATTKYPETLSKRNLDSADFSARRLPEGTHCELKECRSCGIIYSDPAIDPSTLSELYEDAEVIFPEMEKDIYASYEPILKQATSGLDKSGSFVEIGGHTGYMLRFGREHQFKELIEVEPSAATGSSFDGEDTRYIRDLFRPGLLKDNSASLICFFQMLDHVPDPDELIRAVYQALKPGGRAVCVVHNTAAISTRILGEKSPIFSLQHTYLFNHKNLPRLFLKNGFSSARSIALANRYPLDYWAYAFPLPHFLKNLLRKGLKALRIDQLRFPIYAGNVAVIAEK